VSHSSSTHSDAAHAGSPIPPPHFQGSVVHLLLGTEGGGIITTTRQWAPLLTAAGWTIHFVSLAQSKACDMLAASGIKARVVPVSRFGRFTRFPGKIRSLNPRIIHVHNPSAHIMAINAGRHLHASVVRTVHADMFHEMRGTLPGWKIWLWKQAMKRAFRRTDLTTIVSPHLATLLPGVDDPTSVRFLPNSYDPSDIERDRSPLPDGIPRWLGEAPLVLAMGRLVAVKNYAMLLRAWELVVRDHPEARLILAGSGPLEAKLHEQVKAAGLGESVRFLSWIAAVAPLLKRATMIAITSRSECYPMLAFEAMAAGKPVVSTLLDGLQVEDGRTAVLSPSDDHVAFARSVCHLLDEPDDAAQLGRQGRLDLEERFHPRVAAVRMAEAYNSLQS